MKQEAPPPEEAAEPARKKQRRTEAALHAGGKEAEASEEAVKSPRSSASMAKNGFLVESDVAEFSSSDIVTARHSSV